MWKYSHIDETRQKLLSKGIIDLGGEMDENMAMYIRDAMRILATNDNPDIEIIITSNGGNITIGLDIYDMIRTYPGKTTGRVESFCRSIATIVLQACDHRLASRHSEIKIHNVTVYKIKYDLITDPNKLDKFITELRSDQKKINEIYIKRTRRTANKIASQSKKDENMTAQEALKFRLIDEII